MRTFLLFWTAVFFLLRVGESAAQNFPVQATFYSKPPYPIRLSDYANPLGQNLTLKVILRDLNLGPTQVYFKFAINSTQASFGNFGPPDGSGPITLVPGVVQTFTQADFGQNFTWRNLGINPALYAAPLREGIYNFSVEIIDVLTNKSLSGAVKLPPVWLVVNDPPIPSQPANRGNTLIPTPQNLIFQWIPRHRQAAAVEYEFTLTELLVPAGYSGNLQNLFLAQPPYYQTTTLATTLLFGPGQPPLIPGRTYGWRVRAKAKMGFEEVGIFRNDGYSEIFLFTYGQANRAPTIISARWGIDGQAIITWSGIEQQVRYALLHKGVLPPAPVFPPTNNPAIIAQNLARQAEYAALAGSLPGPQAGVYELQNPALTKLGNNTFSVKLPVNNAYSRQFEVGGITGNATDQTLFSTPFVLDPIDWDKLGIKGIKRDYEDYLGLLAGKSRKANPNAPVATCANPTIAAPTDTKLNPIALGDTLHVGGTNVRVVSDEYAIASIKTTGGGSAAVKLYFSADFKINQYNEVITGYLSSEVTNQRIQLISADSNTGEGDIVSKEIKAWGIRTDSLKTVINEFIGQSIGQVQTQEAAKVQGVKSHLPTLVRLFEQKRDAMKSSIAAIDNELPKTTAAADKQKLNALKTKLNDKLTENQTYIDNTNEFMTNCTDCGASALYQLFLRFFQ